MKDLIKNIDTIFELKHKLKHSDEAIYCITNNKHVVFGVFEKNFSIVTQPYDSVIEDRATKKKVFRIEKKFTDWLNKKISEDVSIEIKEDKIYINDIMFRLKEADKRLYSKTLFEKYNTVEFPSEVGDFLLKANTFYINNNNATDKVNINKGLSYTNGFVQINSMYDKIDYTGALHGDVLIIYHHLVTKSKVAVNNLVIGDECIGFESGNMNYMFNRLKPLAADFFEPFENEYVVEILVEDLRNMLSEIKGSGDTKKDLMVTFSQKEENKLLAVSDVQLEPKDKKRIAELEDEIFRDSDPTMTEHLINEVFEIENSLVKEFEMGNVGVIEYPFTIGTKVLKQFIGTVKKEFLTFRVKENKNGLNAICLILDVDKNTTLQTITKKELII